jgi:hypothetical protein
MKIMILFFKLVLKLNRISFPYCFILNIYKFFDDNILYKNDTKNNNSFAIIIKELYLLKQFFYIWLARTISVNYIYKYDVNTILTIIIIIEIIDKSIVNLIEDSFKKNINNITENNLISMEFNNNNKIC